MNRDLTELLREWPFEPGKINVRVVRGTDSDPLIQVRLDLGILQMRAEGRPDGLRPHGFDSLLEYHEARIDELQELGMLDEDPDDDPAREIRGPIGSPPEEARPESSATPDTDDDEPLGGSSDEDDDAPGAAARPRAGFSLSPEACRELREEAVQYYHRYIALLVLDEFEGVIRDTTRNLRVLDLCRRYAATPEDRAAMEQFRPYIMMMRSRAMASQALKENEPKAAIFAIDQGLEALRRFFTDLGHPEAFESASETDMLRGMREALVPKLPVSQKTELRQRLQEALERENYELAAILRDELRLIRE